MPSRTALDRAKYFVFEHFEHLLVVLLVASLLAIHGYVDYKVAFLSFYYLPIIVAGFHLGRNAAVLAALFVISLVVFFQTVAGLDATTAGLDANTALALLPWAGFLVLTAVAVGTLADQRKAHADDLSRAYVTLLDLLTFHLESAETRQHGHSHHVAERAVAVGRELGMRAPELENLRVAALLHELGPRDPRLMRLLEQFPGPVKRLPVAGSMRSALDLLVEYGRYQELVADDWPVDGLRVSTGVKVLAVADAYETLLMPSAGRPPFAPWTALEEIEKGAGHSFGSEVVKALRKVAALSEPVVVDAEARLSLVGATARERAAANAAS